MKHEIGPCCWPSECRFTLQGVNSRYFDDSVVFCIGFRFSPVFGNYASSRILPLRRQFGINKSNSEISQTSKLNLLNSVSMTDMFRKKHENDLKFLKGVFTNKRNYKLVFAWSAEYIWEKQSRERRNQTNNKTKQTNKQTNKNKKERNKRTRDHQPNILTVG